MATQETFARLVRRFSLLLLAAVIVFALPVVAHADIVIQAGSKTAQAGSNGNFLDVTLTNTGPSSVNLGGFAFNVSVPFASGISLTSTTTGTSPASYIFAGNSTLGPNISTTNPGISQGGLDVFSPAGGSATVAAGQTVGLGRVFFNVAGGTAAGVYNVPVSNFVPTNLSTPGGGNIPNFSTSGGQITVLAAQPVPEPGTLALAMTVVPLGAWIAHRRRKALRRS